MCCVKFLGFLRQACNRCMYKKSCMQDIKSNAKSANTAKKFQQRLNSNWEYLAAQNPDWQCTGQQGFELSGPDNSKCVVLYLWQKTFPKVPLSTQVYKEALANLMMVGELGSCKIICNGQLTEHQLHMWCSEMQRWLDLRIPLGPSHRLSTCTIEEKPAGCVGFSLTLPKRYSATFIWHVYVL